MHFLVEWVYEANPGAAAEDILWRYFFPEEKALLELALLHRKVELTMSTSTWGPFAEASNATATVNLERMEITFSTEPGVTRRIRRTATLADEAHPAVQSGPYRGKAARAAQSGPYQGKAA